MIKSDGIKYMTVREFRETGYLQEVNRLYFHPLGLALSVRIEEDGTESFGGIWDAREDPEGIIFDDSQIDDEFRERAIRLEAEMGERLLVRHSELGYLIQPYD